MKLKLASLISFSLLVFMKLAVAADNGVVQGLLPPHQKTCQHQNKSSKCSKQVFCRKI